MKTVQLMLYKSLINFEQATVLDLMRSNKDLLNFPGYKITEMLRSGIEEGCVNKTIVVNKAYYSATMKCNEEIKRLEEEISKEQVQIVQKEKKELKQVDHRPKVAPIIILSVGIVASVVIAFVLKELYYWNVSFGEAIGKMCKYELYWVLPFVLSVPIAAFVRYAILGKCSICGRNIGVFEQNLYFNCPGAPRGKDVLHICKECSTIKGKAVFFPDGSMKIKRPDGSYMDTATTGKKSE